MNRSRVLIFVLTGIVSLGQLSAPQPARAALAPAPSSTLPRDQQTKTPIKHIIFVMQENHTFDNYFGTYPGANGYPSDTKVPIDPNNPAAGFVTPWHIGKTAITDLSHNAHTFEEQFNSGKMDGFVAALNKRRQDGRFALGYYDETDIPYYWNLADHYVLFDRFFSSARNSSFSNHLYSVAALPPLSEDVQEVATQLKSTPTIFDRLQEAGISWKFYVQNYDPTLTHRTMEGAGSRASQVIWVPLLNIDRFIDDPNLNSHIVDLQQYYIDLQQGTLPAVVYIVPSGSSEHPPQYPDAGQRFVKGLIQELMRSKFWNDSAIVVAYDDWGGWYDHVIPPSVDAQGYGLRVPGLLISPYARAGYVDHTELDFTSVLKFIEENWGVQSLHDRDAKANNILTAFDFSQPPRPAQFLPLSREIVKPVKAAPTLVIYAAYSLALVLALFILLTVLRRPKPVINGPAKG